MKHLLVITIAALLMSCNSNSLSQKDKDRIQLQITLHNQNVKLKYDLQKIDVAKAYKMYLVASGIDYQSPQGEQMLQAKLTEFDMNYFELYNIQIDTALTLEKYLKHCEVYNVDPKTYFETLKY